MSSTRLARKSARSRVWKILGFAIGALLILGGVAALAICVASQRQLGHTYAFADERLELPGDAASVARGGHLVNAVASCELCHGADLGGAIYMQSPLGVVAGPNLTRGKGGIGSRLETADWERAIRHGVRRDGTSLIVMPSEVFHNLSDQDAAAMIGWLQALPPVDREVPESHFKLMGRALLATGRLPILVAPKTPQGPHPTRVEPGSTVEYGRYLADIAGCHGCHGYGLSGGRVAGPPDLPPASNLTPAGLSAWTEDDFVRLMREGIRLGGAQVHAFMPWRVFSRMTDDELHALWAYLQSVPAKPTGNK